VRAAVAAAVTATLVLGGCGGGDDDDAALPLLDEIGPAMAAVAGELGGTPQYFEVNATPQVVNLFVASGGGTGVSQFVYVGDELAPIGQPRTAEGNTFTAGAVTFDPDTILDGVTDELPDSDIVLFAIVGGPDGTVQYSAGVQSAAGGTLDVVLGPDGSVQSVVPGTP
jgi:hypothetical protein